MKAIETVSLTKYYGKARGVEGLELTVEQGELFGFIGPNGAGKSTTIRILLGLIRPTSGEARVLGLDCVRDSVAIRSRVGYLPSEAVFYRGMRVRDILKLSAELRKKDCAAEAKSLCERLGLDPSRRAEELSFGNRKKLAIVCALQHEPELLILDEPTGGLDPLMQREFFTILSERRARGATVFLSSHILSEIRHNCTRAAIIRAGRIAAGGSISAIMQTGARRVSLRGEAPLEGLEGVRDMREDRGGLTFLYSGSTEALIAALSRGHVTDLTVTEPDLEEIFMHYYEEGGEGK